MSDSSCFKWHGIVCHCITASSFLRLPYHLYILNHMNSHYIFNPFILSHSIRFHLNHKLIPSETQLNPMKSHIMNFNFSPQNGDLVQTFGHTWLLGKAVGYASTAQVVHNSEVGPTGGEESRSSAKIEVI